MGAPSYLDSAQDAYCPAPGLALSFERYFLPSPSHRGVLGSLGRGWTHSYEITLQQRSDGSVVINGSSGFDRTFASDGQGGYKAGAGDYGRLTPEPDGEFLLTEQSGLQTRFLGNGKFHSIADTNGNRILAGYDAQGRLVAVIQSNGDRFLLDHDASGRLVKLTDHAGRETHFAYDGTGEHLTSVTGPDGRTTTYGYQTGTGVLKDHLLLSISPPGGPDQHFQYDAQGRLAGQYLASGLEPVTYAYSTAGKTAVADAFGNTTTTWLDSYGRTAVVQDPLGFRSRTYYDAASNVTQVVGPTGLSSQFAYDTSGNLVVSRDPMGFETAFGYAGPYNSLAWVRDARGNATNYAYDDRGNLSRITYVNGTFESYQYDGLGNLIASTNRRGQTITYTHNSRAQLTSKDYPDTPSLVDFHYGYDAVGNMTSASGPEGTSSLTYDPATDWLLRVDYPAISAKAIFFTFAYDSAGRRIKRTDQDS
jgi:YD repeat-containing protein